MSGRANGAVALLLCFAALPARAEAGGWARAGKPQSYDSSTVWQAINGAAELHLAYGFRSLRELPFRAGKVEVTAQLFVQGSPLDAFGLFARERPRGGQRFVDGLRGAFAHGGQCLGIKGATYVKIRTTAGKLPLDRCRSLLRKLAGSISGATALPAQLGLLPSAGRIAGSEGFTRKSYLGTRRLQRAVHASYASGGKQPLQRFALLPAAGSDAAASWRSLAKHWTVHRHGGLQLLATKLPYQGTVAVVRGKAALLGVAGAPDLATAARLLRQR